MPHARIGENCRIHRAIVDEGTVIPSGTDIGVDPERDTKCFQISPGGVVVVPCGFIFN
jgi:glucose-1-phosphate adenylyltransferase